MTEQAVDYGYRSYQSQVGVGGFELDVDQLVDVIFTLCMQVLSHRGLHFYNTGK